MSAVMSAVQRRVLLLRHCLEGVETVFLEGNEHILRADNVKHFACVCSDYCDQAIFKLRV